MLELKRGEVATFEVPTVASNGVELFGKIRGTDLIIAIAVKQLQNMKLGKRLHALRNEQMLVSHK